MACRLFVVNSRHVVFEPLSGAFLFIYLLFHAHTTAAAVAAAAVAADDAATRCTSYCTPRTLIFHLRPFRRAFATAPQFSCVKFLVFFFFFNFSLRSERLRFLPTTKLAQTPHTSRPHCKYKFYFVLKPPF